jgi:ankyrin repeat protein
MCIYFSCLQLFLEKGANVNMVNGCGLTPLHEAVNRGEIEICQILLKTGSNPLIEAIKGYNITIIC